MRARASNGTDDGPPHAIRGGSAVLARGAHQQCAASRVAVPLEELWDASVVAPPRRKGYDTVPPAHARDLTQGLGGRAYTAFFCLPRPRFCAPALKFGANCKGARKYIIERYICRNSST